MIKRGFLLAFLLVLLSGPANAQDVLTSQELELEYSSRVQRHQAALNAWEVLESRFQRALEEFSVADSLGDSDRRNRAFTISQQLSGEIIIQERRVGELAQELRDSRSALLTALQQRVEELYQQSEAVADPQEQRELATLLQDANNRYLELRAEEDPETSLEPMQDITIGPRDTPVIIRRKAEALEFRASRYEAQLAGVGRRLEELRQDQRRTRRVNDFMAGLERYDDTRMPVVPPGSRTVQPPDPALLPTETDTLGVEARPMTLEERIASLELLERELELRLQQVRDKAALFRQRAGGGGR